MVTFIESIEDDNQVPLPDLVPMCVLGNIVPRIELTLKRHHVDMPQTVIEIQDRHIILNVYYVVLFGVTGRTLYHSPPHRT